MRNKLQIITMLFVICLVFIKTGVQVSATELTEDQIEDGWRIYQLDFAPLPNYPNFGHNMDIVTDTEVVFFTDTKGRFCAMLADNGIANLEIYYVYLDSGKEGSKSTDRMTEKYSYKYSSSFADAYKYSNFVDCTTLYTNDSVKIFDSEASARAYIDTGDMSGLVEEIVKEYETVNDNEFSLTGFLCNNSIFASWTGVTNGSSTTLVWDDVYVKVEPNYFLILEAGEEEQDYETVGAIDVPFTEYSFSKAYSDYFVNNPYAGRSQLLLSFTPYRFSEETNVIIKGKPILVKFDENGKITSLDVPESSITPSFNNSLEFRNFTANNEFHNFGDSYVHCYWNGVNIDTSINYIYSDIKIQLYASPVNVEDQNSHEWIDYEHDDIISFNSNRLSLNLSELDTYCRSIGYRFCKKNYEGNYDGEKIRLTPYCKTSTDYYYGKSVEITLGPLGGIDAIMQSTGDAISDTNPDYVNLDDNYISDGTFIENVMDDIFGEDDTELDLNGIATDFFQALSSFFKLCGQFPSLVTNVLGFLPEYYRTMLVIALGAVIILRILGR